MYNVYHHIKDIGYLHGWISFIRICIFIILTVLLINLLVRHK